MGRRGSAQQGPVQFIGHPIIRLRKNEERRFTFAEFHFLRGVAQFLGARPEQAHMFGLIGGQPPLFHDKKEKPATRKFVPALFPF